MDKWVKTKSDHYSILGGVKVGKVYQVKAEGEDRYQLLGLELDAYDSEYFYWKDDFVEVKLTGYKLVKPYPGMVEGIGAIIPAPSKFCTQWPEFWEPIFEEVKPLSITLSLGSNEKGQKIPIYITEGKMLVADATLRIEDLELWLQAVRKPKNRKVGIWQFIATNFKIGCCTFTREELITIQEAWDKINP